MNKETRNTVIILVILLIAYLVFKFNNRNNTEYKSDPNAFNPPPRPHTGSSSTTTNTVTNLGSGECVNPKFKYDYNGRECAGEVINEKKTLKLGDESCEVLLLQQRLNSMQNDAYILAPTGRFDCETKFKLNLLMGVPQITLNDFSPDEQIGFNELEGGSKITPYSYMDVNNKII
tara:strand:+ start:8619 stop:9143 length:525 start_codon:yes stop_codon:yes gene_type:complete